MTPARSAVARAASPLLVVAALAMAGCASTPPDPVALAARYAFVTEEVSGSAFRHRVFRNSAAPSDWLHVYLEGDGVPHPQPWSVAADPTSSHLVALPLMALDRERSVYVGRPCYFRVADAACQPDYWTLRRYSPEVIDSVVAAIRSEQQHSGARHLVLIGHSGGAVLAWSAAARIEQVAAVVTLAGNLDVAAWTALHHYTPLVDAASPVDIPIRRTGFIAIHYAGERDRTIPPAMARAAVERTGGELRIVAQADHTCCWQEIWPEVLREIDARVRSNAE